MIRAIPLLLLCLLAGPAAAAPPSWQDDLDPIPPEAWNAEYAAHLLARAGFGGPPEEVAALAELAPRDAVHRLVRYHEQPNVPLPVFEPSGIFPSEDFVPPTADGQAKYFIQGFIRKKTLGIELARRTGPGWAQPVLDQLLYLRIANVAEGTRVGRYLAQRALLTKRPLEEKLALYWHGHFATENDKVRDYRKLLAQSELFREKGNGPFRELLLAVCRDPAMLIYLDGYRNVRGQPNENFARELLELFTLGDGSYSERDVKEAARAFTGWGLDGNEFDASWWRHDKREKTFLGKSGRFDGEDIVDIILEQPQAARFLAGKLYRYFVREDPSPETLSALAAVLRESGHDVGTLLETVFLSRDFYSDATRGSRIKSPVELVVGTYRRLELEDVPGVPNFNQVTAGLGQQLLAPPNVAGWAGGRSWINPSTLIDRQNFARYVLFPREHPLPRRRLLDFVADIIGRDAYEQLNQMARQGDFEGAPVMSEDESGFARQQQALSFAGFNAFRGVYNGARKALNRIRFDDPLPAEIDLVTMMRMAGVSTPADVVAFLVDRFLAVPPRESDRTELAEFLAARVGGNELDFEREALEVDLRELLHLILSLPEYQLT